MSRLLTFLLLFICSGNAYAYQDRKVILLVGRETQPDSLGYNIVEDLSAAIYTGIQDGSVTLWDSPKKEFRYSLSDLAANENSNRAFFIRSTNIFLYETWTSTKTRFSHEPKGMSFAGENARGEEVLFGYVEYGQPVQQAIARHLMRTNANGYYGVSAYQVLMNLTFDFSLMYSDGIVYTDVARGNRVVDEALHSGKKNLNHIPVMHIKRLEYTVETGLSPLSRNSRYLMQQFQDFFTANPQEFFNIGGDRITTHLKKTPILVTGLVVIEDWKEQNGTLSFDPVQIIPYVVGVPLDPVDTAQLSSWGILVDSTSMLNEIRGKNYYYRITRINFATIPPEQQESYKEALLRMEWEKINELVTKQEP